MSFRFVDLFAGIGGFHAALSSLGGECVYAVEIDEQAARVYEANWGRPGGRPVRGDITLDADEEDGVMNVPPHDVLCAGFPCQPFSKSGAQRGMDEARGTLFFNIMSIVRAHHPSVVLLENVRNLAGPRHEHEWDIIVRSLREEGYHVSGEPAVFSPHLLPAWMGGSPQVRERVFITATYAPGLVPLLGDGRVDVLARGPEPVASMKSRFPRTPTSDKSDHFVPGDADRGWNLLASGVLDDATADPSCELTVTEKLWIDAWDEFVVIMRERTGKQLKGFPYWADSWLDFPEVAGLFRGILPTPVADPETGRFTALAEMDPAVLPSRVTRPSVERSLPAWKQSHLRKNYEMFADHWEILIPWAYRWGIFTSLFPSSRRKLEWQAQDADRLWSTVMHLRPSGIRAKRPTYVPALVAITQTSIVGPLERRLSPRETARLQGLSDDFSFAGQPARATYKQMGNGVSVGAVRHVFLAHVERDRALVDDCLRHVHAASRDHTPGLDFVTRATER